MSMRAISVRQPWAFAIVHAGKDIENRSRATGHRGPVLIHASSTMTDDDFREAAGFIAAQGLYGVWAEGVKRDALLRGGIIGVAEIVDCVRESPSPWFFGPVGLALRNARPLPFTPCRGTVAPMCWAVPPEVAKRLSGLV